MGRLLTVLVALAALTPGGCTVGDSEPPTPSPEARAAAEAERVIRGWTEATAAGDFRRAGGFFAPGAIVEQFGEESRLDGAAGGERFSAGLPCRARVTRIVGERGAALAIFELSAGRTGQCAEGGTARVRFVVSDGLIREWRQLPEAAPDAPGGGSPPEPEPESRDPSQIS